MEPLSFVTPAKALGNVQNLRPLDGLIVALPAKERVKKSEVDEGDALRSYGFPPSRE
jgi:hypothetical protein